MNILNHRSFDPLSCTKSPIIMQRRDMPVLDREREETADIKTTERKADEEKPKSMIVSYHPSKIYMAEWNV